MKEREYIIVGNIAKLHTAINALHYINSGDEVIDPEELQNMKCKLYQWVNTLVRKVVIVD